MVAQKLCSQQIAAYSHNLQNFTMDPNPSQVPRTLQLASSILATVNKLENYLKDNGLPTCSFQPGASYQTSLPPNLRLSIEEALSDLDELTMLLLGPMGWMTLQLGRSFDMVSMHAMYRYKIPQQFSIDETVTTAELARRCGADESIFTRLVQHAVPKGFLAQPKQGHVAHTAFSAMLAASPAITDFVGYVCEDLQPAAAHIPNALTKWPGPPWLPNQTGHNLATGTSGTFWDTLANDPARSQRFASSMSFMQCLPGWQPTAALDVYDWGALDSEAVVVDVGGGDGTFALALAERHSSLRQIIVQDVPAVVEQARAGIPEHLRDVIEPQAHDFFEPQPVEGASVYFLRKILHDWPDELAVKILRQLIPALKPGARVLINDHFMPPPGVLSSFQDWNAMGQDLAMMALFNSKERNGPQWKELIARADPRFVLKSVTPMPPGPLALIELVWE